MTLRSFRHRGRRGATPVVGKVLEAGIVVLYIGLLTTILYGGLVPDYRAAAGAEVGDRALAEATQEIQGSVPASRHAEARATVDLPDRIQGSNYQVRAVEQSGDPALVLDHPDPEVGGTVPVLLPDDVTAFEGAWESTDPAVLVVEQTEDGRVVELRRGGEPP